MITFKLPTQLRALAGGQKTIEVSATTLGDAFRQLDAAAPMIRSQVFDEAGNVRTFVGVFVNAQQLTSLSDDSRPLHPDSQVSIVMAVAGG
jgi:molybdopterin converting factor small subunit